ncbi:hypothetical protein GGF43_006500 [Coemansia sp. RSA 2618]|nr:hypothetical protein GGF43_006500 [Coemansia sp. RSA 2618]
MSNDLVRFINDHQLGPVVLLGHSMGGKTVMQTTLERPDLVSQLIVDDIAPMRLDMAHDFAAYVEKLKYIERMDIKSQSQADAMLQEVEPDISVRQFLLTNMKKDRETGAYRSRIPLQLLGDSLQSVMDWDVEGKSYEGPTLFIGGERSLHIREKAFPCMKKCFPNYELEMLDTGHWVHAEMPREFMQLVEEFVIRHS